MTHSRSDAPAPVISCGEMDLALRDWDIRVRRRLPLGEGRGPDSPSLSTLRKHARSCPRCAKRHRHRLSRVEAFDALRARKVPPGALEGLYEGVRSRSHLAAPGGGMSSLFLDAPRSLRIWRTAAIAASLLLVAGTGYVLTKGAGGESPVRPGGIRPLQDPRGHLLEAFEPIRRVPADGLLLRPVQAPGPRGHGAFFGPVRTHPAGYDEDNGREVQLR